jgi:hypothetical protein
MQNALLMRIATDFSIEMKCINLSTNLYIELIGFLFKSLSEKYRNSHCFLPLPIEQIRDEEIYYNIEYPDFIFRILLRPTKSTIPENVE